MQCCVMLECLRLPNLNPRETARHYPGAKDENLSYRLLKIAGESNLCNFPAVLEDPESLGASIASVAPGCVDLVSPSESCSDICRSLRSSNEDEIQTTLQIVRLEGSADRGGDLEGGLA